MQPPADDHEDPLFARIRDLGTDLRVKLSRAMSLAVPPDEGPTAAARHLGLDKTLASRLMRGLRENDEFKFLAEIPGPPGLRLALRAIESKAPEGDETTGRLAEARQLVDAFEALAKELPGGRNGLDIVLGAELEEHDAQIARRARQAAYRSMQVLLGTYLELSYNAYVYAPGEDGKWSIGFVGLRRDFRRLRPTGRIVIGGIPGTVHFDESAGQFRTLTGERFEDPPMNTLLEDRCSGDLSGLSFDSWGSGYHVYFPPGSPPLNEPVSLATGIAAHNLVEVPDGSEPFHDCTTITVRKATKTYVNDFLVDADAAPDELPILTAQVAASGAVTLPRTGEEVLDPLLQVDRLDELGVFGEVAAPIDVPEARGLVERVLDGLDARGRRFRHYRLSVPYPLAATQYRIWTRLR